MQIPRGKVRFVGVTALARELDIPQSTVTQMLQRGRTIEEIRAYAAMKHGAQEPVQGPAPRPEGWAPAPATADASPGEYDLVIATREKIDALDDAKLRRARGLADKQDIENMVRRGELVPAAYYRRWCSTFLINGRDELLRVPGELADVLASESDPIKVRATLTAAMERVCGRFAELNRIWESNLDLQS